MTGDDALEYTCLCLPCGSATSHLPRFTVLLEDEIKKIAVEERVDANTARSRCRWSVPAAARVERCVNVTDSLMARPNGSSAPASARQYGFPLPLLLRLFCNQSCGHQQVDMLSLLLGRSRPGRLLVTVFLASLVRIVRDDTSRLVAAPRQMNCKHGRIIGQAAMVRRSRTGHVVDMFVGRTQRHVARALSLGRLSPGGLRTVLGGGSK